jgi:hypothetical protein
MWEPVPESAYHSLGPGGVSVMVLKLLASDDVSKDPRAWESSPAAPAAAAVEARRRDRAACSRTPDGRRSRTAPGKAEAAP